MFNYPTSFCFPSAGPMENNAKLVLQHGNSKIAKSSKKRPDDTNKTVEALVKIVWQDGDKTKLSPTNRLNRNVVYAQINALLVREIHLNGLRFTRDIDICRGVQINVNRGEFLFVMRTDGRFVTISEEAEFHLGKNMRALYAQCINVFDCLDEKDGAKLKEIFDSSQSDFGNEHRLVCTLRLPRGKRPSRVREDLTTITMSGHFYSCHFPSSSTEKLFVARCQSLLSRLANKTNSTNVSSSNNFEISLNDDMTISSVSSNVEELLGYRRNEIVNHWFGRFLASEDFEKFSANQIRTFQHDDQTDSKLPKAIQDVCDIYTKNGDSRLTFLYEIRAKRTRKTRPLKFDVHFQLIDPLLRVECLKHLETEPESKTFVQAVEVNFDGKSVSPSRKDSVLADSPIFAGALFNCDPFSPDDFSKTFPEFLSGGAAPIEFDQQLDFDFNKFDGRTFGIDFESECYHGRQTNAIFDHSIDLLTIHYGF